MRSVADFGLAVDMRAVTCPACGYHVAVPFYDGGSQPLATLAWPGSEDEARKMLGLNALRCYKFFDEAKLQEVADRIGPNADEIHNQPPPPNPDEI